MISAMRPRILSMSCLLMAATLMMAQGIKRHEYWIDSDYGSAQSVVTGDESVSITIPIAGLSSGIHFLNYRVLNTDDEWGTLNRMLFYVPEEAVGNATVKSCEYWLDSDHANRKKGGSGTNLTAAIDVSKLSSGIHFFNYLAVNNYDEKGTLSRMLFYIPETEVGDATVSHYEYWIDNDYANKKGGDDATETIATIDISKLSSGIHFFNYRAVNNFGEAGTLCRTLFYIPEQREENPTITAYEYWLDEDVANKVTGEETKEVYELAMDISKMKDGDHTFSFRAKNSNGDWSMVHTESFVLYGNAFIKEDGVTYIAPDNGEQTLAVSDAEKQKTEVEIPVTISVGETEYTVTVIVENAFEGNTALLKITIPETVISIGASAFAGCTNLTDIFSYAKDPIALGAKSRVATRAGGDEVNISSVFDQVDKKNCTLHVPFGSKEKYMAADGWMEFTNIVEIISGIPGDANSDWKVNADDIDVTVDYIMKGKTEGFVFENADTNGDDKVDAADIVKIVNMVNSTVNASE